MRRASRSLSLLFMIQTGVTWAAERSSIFISTRQAGRGNTFAASYDSPEAARFNPACLAESKAIFQLRPLQFDASFGQNSMNTVSELIKLSSVDDGLGFLRSFDNKFGQRQYMRGQLSGLAMRIKSFEILLMGSSASWLELRNPTTPEAEFESDSFAGIHLSYGLKLGPKLALGATLRPLTRAYIHGQMVFTDIIDLVPPATTSFEDAAPLQTGTGYGADLGIIYQPTAALRLGITAQNVGDTAFKSTDEAKAGPPPLRALISTGALYRLKYGRWDLDLSADIQDIINRSALNLTRLVNFGAEFGRTLYGKDHDIGIVTGIREGYFSGGAFLDIWLMRFDLANYAVELGETPGQRMDRRWALSVQTSMSF